MESTIEKEKIWYELARIYQKNVNVASFTTLLNVTSNIANTSAMDAFFYEKDSKGVLNLRIIKTTKRSFRTVSSCYTKRTAKEY